MILRNKKLAENLGGTYDKASCELTFYTDKFSTYAIAYTVSNGGADRPSVPVVTPTVTDTTVKKQDDVISDKPYIEDVSSAAVIAAIAAKKHFCNRFLRRFINRADTLIIQKQQR